MPLLSHTNHLEGMVLTIIKLLRCCLPRLDHRHILTVTHVNQLHHVFLKLTTQVKYMRDLYHEIMHFHRILSHLQAATPSFDLA
jgi:hypothetical protein